MSTTANEGSEYYWGYVIAYWCENKLEYLEKWTMEPLFEEVKTFCIAEEIPLPNLDAESTMIATLGHHSCIADEIIT